MDAPITTPYAENLKKLEALNPLLASCLPATSCHHLTLVDTHGQLNLRYEGPEHTFFLHAPESPTDEARDWFAKLDLSQTNVLFVYGIGLGYYFEAARPWLDTSPRNRLVFLESDLAVLHRLLETDKAAAILAHPQVEIQDISQITEDHTSIYWLAWDSVADNAQLTALTAYQRENLSTLSLLSDLIAYEMQQAQSSAREKLSFAIDFFNQFYRNLYVLPDAYLGSALFGKFAGVPAIICGSGPSLEKHLPLLKELGNKALLFAPGSAANILTANGITPHFGVVVDPNAESYHRVITSRAFTTPFFYRGRVHNEALNTIPGARLYIGGSGDYSIATWFEEQLGLPLYDIEEGQNVVNFAVSIATHLGCNPIIFVGMDLSLPEGRHYATGIERHPLYSQNLQAGDTLGPPTQVYDDDDNMLMTYWPWIAEAQWTDYFSFTHPDILFLNATEGGLGFSSIESKTLKEVIDTYLVKDYDIAQRITSALESGKQSIQIADIDSALNTFTKSLQRCKDRCEALLAGSEPLPSLEFTLGPSFEEEPAFLFLLADFGDFFLQMTHHDLRSIYRSHAFDASPPPQDPYAQIKIERLRFFQRICSIHLELIALILKEPRVRRPYPSLPEPLHEGQSRCYYPNGTLYMQIERENDLLDGTVIINYPDGKMKRELHFKKGVRDGIERSWYDNGQLFTQVTYQAGNWKRAQCWHTDGTLVKDLENK